MQAETNITAMTNFVCKREIQVIDGVRYCRLALSGEFPDWKTEASQMHMLLRFYREIAGSIEERLYPFFVKCSHSQSGSLAFEGQADIRLDSLFMDFENTHSEVPFQVALLSLNQDMQWSQKSLDIVLQTEWLVPAEKKENVLQRIGRKGAFAVCTLLLPLWLLSGVLALKGIGRLRPAAKGMSGKRAIIYHAHDLVKGWTGYGYSMREYKTAYFKRCYEKYCARFPETEGVLFLSERSVDKGGNLDLVRTLLQKTTSMEIREFLTQRPVHKLSAGELRHCAELAAQARVIVLEDFFPQLHALDIRCETEILQLWHACGAFKLFGLSELGKTDLPQETRNHRNYTAALTSSEGIAPFYSEAFGIPERCIAPIGVPRTDVFFDERYREQAITHLYESYPAWRGKRIVLFAPTFRGSGNKTAYYPMERFPINAVMQKLPADTILLVKQHPFVKVELSVEEAFHDRVFDLTGKENINDLLFVTDLLVTDYSSSVFEAALLNIPMLFYAFDLEEYLADRDLYFDFSAFAPGKIVGELDDLLEEINRQLQQTEAACVSETFRTFFLGALDGHATERTVGLIRQMYQRNLVTR